MQKNKQKVTIIETGHFFLYLPVHYAESKGWFKYIPPEYEVCIASTPKASATDREAYDLLMKRRAVLNDVEHENIAFAIADPAQVLNDLDDFDDYRNPPVVLAALVTNASFWAVDRKTHKVQFLKDLAAFDKIIAFKKGSTSYGIAKRIYRDAKKTPAIEVVNQDQELIALINSPEGTMVALTPDLLGLHNLVHDPKKGFKIDLPLGKTPEYHNVLVTALLSRTDVVNKRRNQNLVHGLLKAIQRAMLEVSRADVDQEIIDFAKDIYTNAYEEDNIRGALEMAMDAHVFPDTIEINEATWQKMARAAADTEGRQWNRKEHKRIFDVYRSAVKPYRYMAKEEIDDLNRNGLEDIETSRPKRSSFFIIKVFCLATVLLLVGGLALLLNLLIPALVAVVLAVAVCLTFKLKMSKMVLGIQIFWLIIGLVLLLFLVLAILNNFYMSTFMAAWITGEITILLRAVKTSGRK